ncbi:MAG TPA: hypothetical protein VND87_02245 [Stellaceae bacterium]|nr:hypothetical protein [Stellaceae bacterium]
MNIRVMAACLVALLLPAGAHAASVWEFDGACKAVTKEGDKAADLSKTTPTAIPCEAAMLMRGANGVAVLTAGKLNGGGVPIGFGSSNFQLKSSGKMVTMSVDTLHVGTAKGVDATGACLFFGPDIGKVTTISCNATVVTGSRKKLIGVNIKVASVRVIQAQ